MRLYCLCRDRDKQGQNSDPQGRAWTKQGREKVKNDDTVVTMLPFFLITWYLPLVKAYLTKYLFHPPTKIWHLSKFIASFSTCISKEQLVKEKLADVTWKKVSKIKEVWGILNYRKLKRFYLFIFPQNSLSF